ncbi:hypothetical protein PGB90_006846 [Kerria lacca]
MKWSQERNLHFNNAYKQKDIGLIMEFLLQLNWLRRLWIHNYFREYFPIRLIKTAELPPDNNYLLILYPHGIVTASLIANFATEANQVESKVFPGIDMRFVTLNMNIYLPVIGEYFLALGACGASEYHISYLLEQKPSTAVVLVAGGASEAKLASPGSQYKIIASRRKGFVRIALKNGVSLVPVFSFGENNTYDQYNLKWLPFISDIISRYTGIQVILMHGRGLLQNYYGLLPRRTHINTVVGKPIALPKVENPSEELINKYHKQFFQELMELFEEYKHEYDCAGNEAQLITL